MAGMEGRKIDMDRGKRMRRRRGFDGCGEDSTRGIVFVTKPNSNRYSLHGRGGIERRFERENRNL